MNIQLESSGRSDAATYASRMHLGRVLDGLGVRHDLPAVRERRVGDRLLEVTSLRTPDDVLALAALVERRLRARGSRSASAMAEAVSELGINVPDHADPAVNHRLSTGYVAAQTMPRSDEVVFAIADFGVGMRSTLAARGAEDDHQAITLALGGTSRFADDPDRGCGLRSIEELVRDLSGSLYVVSGRSSVLSARPGRRAMMLDEPYLGTLIQARIPLV